MPAVSMHFLFGAASMPKKIARSVGHKLSNFCYPYWSTGTLWRRPHGNNGKQVTDNRNEGGPMICFLKRINVLDQMGGQESVLEWTAAEAKHWLPVFCAKCEQVAEQETLRTLQNGKHGFLTHVVPTFNCSRPVSISLGTIAGLSLHKFLLSAQLLDPFGG